MTLLQHSGKYGLFSRWLAQTGLIFLVSVFSLASTVLSAAELAPGDILYKGSGSRLSFPPAVFRHWTHRQRYRCSVCHEKIFISKQGANKTTMKEMEEGKYCGVCHNKKEAFNIEFANCTLCHKDSNKELMHGVAGKARVGK